MRMFKNKTVLITGHTGFKGSWLSIWLTHLGASVVGVSNNEVSKPSVVRGHVPNYLTLQILSYIRNADLICCCH